QIARNLTRQIVAAGGRIVNLTEITRLVEQDGRIAYVQSAKGDQFYGDLFISNAHPVKTIEMTESDLIKKAFRSRLRTLENSISVFYVNVVLKRKSMRYVNHNYYYFANENTWSVSSYTDENWPLGYAMYFTSSSAGGEFADGVTLMTYMRFEDVEEWRGTFNTVGAAASRGGEYDQFKKKMCDRLFA